METADYLPSKTYVALDGHTYTVDPQTSKRDGSQFYVYAFAYHAYECPACEHQDVDDWGDLL